MWPYVEETQLSTLCKMTQFTCTELKEFHLDQGFQIKIRPCCYGNQCGIYAVDDMYSCKEAPGMKP